jgi:O-antigen/teichoic acid export membrane protein
MFNVAVTGAAGLAGVVIARSLGPATRGEYAAIMVWFRLVLSIGEIGQPAATTYFVAAVPKRAAHYVATSRNLMVAAGSVTLAAGIVAAPVLASGHAALTLSFRMMFATCLVSFLGAGYTFALQSTALPVWNLVRASQPVAFVIAIALLLLTGHLGLLTVLVTLAATITAQAVLAYALCSRYGLTGGRAELGLAGPMVRFGLGQLAATMPAVVVAQLDQLVLSLVAPPADFGRYAVAASLTALAAPFVSALGNVAFPRLASRALSPDGTERLQRVSVLASVGLGGVLMAVLAGSATWLVPAVFGADFRAAVPLVWLLAPGGVFLACGQVSGDLLRGFGRPLAVAKAQASAAVVTMLLMPVLLPTLGVAGAAVASSASALVAFLHMMRALRRPPARLTATTAAA